MLLRIIDDWRTKRTEKQRLWRNRTEIGCFIHDRQYIFADMAKRNNDYLAENIVHRDDIVEITQDHRAARQAIVDNLESLPHIYRPREDDVEEKYPETPDGVWDLTTRQLVRVYLLMEALGMPGFRQHVGTLMQGDFEDPYTEHGGFILFDGNNLDIHPVESEHTKERDTKNKGSYQMPKEALEIPHIFKYHFHAKGEDFSEFAHPSDGHVLGDIQSCHDETMNQGESHSVIFTKIPEGFNVDYLGGEYIGMSQYAHSVMSATRITVLDLGNYETV